MLLRGQDNVVADIAQFFYLMIPLNQTQHEHAVLLVCAHLSFLFSPTGSMDRLAPRLVLRSHILEGRGEDLVLVLPVT